MLEIWRYTISTMLHPHHKTMAFLEMGFRFHWRSISIIFQRHMFVLVAIVTKWTEAVPLKNMMHKEVISFVLEHIIHNVNN
jgi:hypothetical protein